MTRSGMSWWRIGSPLLAVLLAASPVAGAGFGIFEQGARGMGMAGAYTAQADDPSAMFHNVGGLAFQRDRAFLAGVTWITSTEADFQGASPFPGPTQSGEQEDLSEFPPHFYWVEPIGDSWTFGVAVNSPFGLTTDWTNPDRWSGRFISEEAALRAIDLNPNLAFQLTPRLGVGFGAIVRMSEVELHRRQAEINPFTNQPAEVARVGLESDFNEGYGWQLGLLWRYNNSFSMGFSYRSALTVDYEGDARFTQVPTGFPAFDALVAQAIPFGTDIPITTEVEFPDMASLGLLFAVAPNVRVETDFNWTGWSSFDRLLVQFEGAALPPLEREERWNDVYNYRLGIRWMRPGGREWRFGYVYDENPIPDETLGPLLPDGDRNGITVGYGWTGNRAGGDVALMYLPFDERRIGPGVDHEENFFGTYQTTAWLLGLSVNW